MTASLEEIEFRTDIPLERNEHFTRRSDAFILARGPAMPPRITNIHTSPFVDTPTQRGGLWRHLDLGGDHLGVRIEVLLPHGTSSIHHFHTLEEEHVLALAGTAILHFGDDEHDLREGDHVWFPAGERIAHHIENRSDSTFEFLVFGERRSGDVVFYPNRGVMLVKALGNARIAYTKAD